MPSAATLRPKRCARSITSEVMSALARSLASGRRTTCRSSTRRRGCRGSRPGTNSRCRSRRSKSPRPARGSAPGCRSHGRESISERSVISSTSCMLSLPHNFSAFSTRSGRSRWVASSPGRLTATDSSPQSCCHSLDWRSAVFNAHIVSFLIWPVRSAMGMKTSGDTVPRELLFQRINASAPIGRRSRQPHLGLVVHDHLAALDRAVQLHLQVPQVGDAESTGVVDREPGVLPVQPRRGERAFRLPQQVFGMRGVLRAHRRAHRHAGAWRRCRATRGRADRPVAPRAATRPRRRRRPGSAPRRAPGRPASLRKYP